MRWEEAFEIGQIVHDAELTKAWGRRQFSGVSKKRHSAAPSHRPRKNELQPNDPAKRHHKARQRAGDAARKNHPMGNAD